MAMSPLSSSWAKMGLFRRISATVLRTLARTTDPLKNPHGKYRHSAVFTRRTLDRDSLAAFPLDSYAVNHRFPLPALRKAVQSPNHAESRDLPVEPSR